MYSGMRGVVDYNNYDDMKYAVRLIMCLVAHFDISLNFGKL